MSFNPHTHAGCDTDCSQHPVAVYVSIHTPTQGVTLVMDNIRRLKTVSIHTPTQGVTHL